jgi:hypothetical protein
MMVSLGAGLSAAGQAVSNFAGTAGLEQQKADLEGQKLQLANQLATQRESFGRQEAAGIASSAAVQQEQLGEKGAAFQAQQQISVKKSEAEIALAQIPQVAKAQAAALEANASDPKFIAATKAMVDANTTDEQRAAANSYRQQAALTEVQKNSAQALVDAKKALANAQTPQDAQKARQDLLVAEYSSHDEVQRASALAAVATNDRMQLQTLQNQLANKQIPQPMETLEMAKAREIEVRALQSQIALAQNQYEISRGMASRAAEDVPALPGGATSQAPAPSGAPNLSKYLKTPAGTSVPAPAAGLINQGP